MENDGGCPVVSDVLILGGGIAGACAGYFLAERAAVTLLEMEDVPGYHSTSRSAALFSEYYGNRCVRALTAASRPFFEAPPPGFAEHPLLAPRGVLALAPHGAEARFATALAEGRECSAGVRELELDEVQELCPIVKPGWYGRAMHKPGAMDVDVEAVHQGFLRGLRAKGGSIVTRARVRRLARTAGLWRAHTDAGEFAAPLVVDAAGAWADELAGLAGVRPLGLVPKRRTACLVDPPEGVSAAGWPLVAEVTGFYFKPESGRLMISPADETPVEPCDARHDDLDVALAAERMEEVTTLRVRRISHRWAGLRTFAHDETPVVGPSADAEGFFWLAGLGGFGVQVAPSVGRALAALVAGDALPADLTARGISAAALSPGRAFAQGGHDGRPRGRAVRRLAGGDRDAGTHQPRAADPLRGRHAVELAAAGPALASRGRAPLPAAAARGRRRTAGRAVPVAEPPLRRRPRAGQRHRRTR